MLFWIWHTNRVYLQTKITDVQTDSHTNRLVRTKV